MQANPPTITRSFPFRSITDTARPEIFRIPRARESDVSNHVAARWPWKRGIDLFLVLAGLPVILPVIGACALWVKAVSPGPSFFRQERVGKDGRRFTLYKLRSMEPASDTTRHRFHVRKLASSAMPMVKLDKLGDPRFIPGGCFLRSTGLDELPQLLNVLTGEMSLVGPRPCLPYEYDLYPPSQRRRFDVPPGLTGLWQVSGKNRLTFRRMRALDRYYSAHVSPWTDLMILGRTPLAVCRQMADDWKGAGDRPRVEGWTWNALKSE